MFKLHLFFNVGKLGLTRYLVIVSIVAVSAMALLACRVSEDYWKCEEAKASKVTKGNVLENGE